MTRRAATTAERAAEVERERRARAQRERERRRLEEQRARPEVARRRARAEHSPRPRARARAGASSGTAVRERHEGLVGWLARVTLAVPAAMANVLRGFVLEVLAVVAGAARAALGLLPGASRIADAQRTVRERSPGFGLPASVTGTKPRRQPRARRAPTEAQLRALERRRAVLRRRLRLACGVALLAAAVLAWIYVPGSDAFRIRHVAVTGTSAVGDLEARMRIDDLLRGQTIYTVDDEAIVKGLKELPFVRSARVERHLPGGLELQVTEYRPLALGYGDGRFWLVAHDGRILAKASRKEWSDRIPLVSLRGNDLRPGVRVDDEPALRLLAARASGSTLALARVEVEAYRLVGWLKGDAQVQIRFGRADLLAQKVAVAELMLREARRKDLDLVYVDVSVPSRPAICARQHAGCLLPRESPDERGRAADADEGGDAGGAAPATQQADAGETASGDEASDKPA